MTWSVSEPAFICLRLFLNHSLLSLCLDYFAKMASISGKITVYRNSDVIERFRSRIFKEDMHSLNAFKSYVEAFLSLKEKAKELGIQIVSSRKKRSQRNSRSRKLCNLHTRSVGSGETTAFGKFKKWTGRWVSIFEIFKVCDVHTSNCNERVIGNGGKFTHTLTRSILPSALNLLT